MNFNNQLLQKQKIYSNLEYREYLQKNANEIMKNNLYCNLYNYNDFYIQNNELYSNTPHICRTNFDKCDSNKLDYPQTDLRKEFIDNTNLKLRMISPYMGKENIANLS